MMSRFKSLYAAFSLLIALQLYQVVMKSFNDFYFNLFALGAMALLVSVLGWMAGVRRAVVIIWALLVLALVLAVWVTVWNGPPGML